MAPGLVDNLPDRSVNDAETLYKKDKNQSAQYKEAFSQSAASTNYEGELKGSSKHPPAKVRMTLRVVANDH
jgi:sulfonate dioxygenase